MFKERYMKMNEEIKPDQTLEACVLEQAEKVKERRVYRRPAIVVALILVVCLGTVPVAAHVADLFIPVQKSCEYDGIRMEVESIKTEADKAQIYVTMQDLTGDRIDETTDLFDSYRINIPEGNVGGCQRVDFDEETGKVRFLIEIQSADGDHLTIRKKIHFSVGRLLTNKQVYKNLPVELNLADTAKEGEAQLVKWVGRGGVNGDQYFKEGQDETLMLVPQEPLCQFIEGVEITGAGYIDGLWHIQTAVVDYNKNDNHGYFQLKDAAGSYVESVYSVSTTESLADGTDVYYHEEAFDLSQEELANYTLYADFTTSGMLVEGDWKVSFRLE